VRTTRIAAWALSMLVCAGPLRICAAPSAAPSPDVVPAPSYEMVRGIILSTHGDGEDWGSDGAVASLHAIHDLGAGWVAIHPYAGIGGDGSVRFRPIDVEHPPDWLARPIREAHAMGMKLLIVPHLAHWGSPFRWRGDISFRTQPQWERFFTEYTDWMVTLASACRNADGFCVGSELDGTIDHEAQWRALIARVRAVTPAALTYGANWTAYEHVRFWDALDVVGIQAYFPLIEGKSPQDVSRWDDATLDRSLRDGWARIVARLRPFALAHNRPIVFTELGYNCSWDAPLQPWAYPTDGPEAERVQTACMRAALEATASEPWILGAFLWKWFPEPWPAGRNFKLATPAMEKVIAAAWGPHGQPRPGH
jgi:Glycoside Hydrolase Family 113